MGMDGLPGPPVKSGGGARSDFRKEQKKCQSPGGYVADLLRGNHAFAREEASSGGSSIRFLAGAELGVPMTAILKVSRLYVLPTT